MAERDVAAELAIRELVARYSEAVSRGDAKAFAATWAEDGEWLLLGQRAVGPEATTAQWQRLVRGFEFVVQLCHGGIIEVEGATASGRWQISEYGRGKDGSSFFSLGFYADRYACSDDCWRFQSRHFEAVYAGPIDLSGAATSLPGDS